MKFFALLTECQLEELNRDGEINYMYRTLIDSDARNWLIMHIIQQGHKKPAESTMPFILFPSKYHSRNWRNIEVEFMENTMYKVDLEIPEQELRTNLVLFYLTQWNRATLGMLCREKHGIPKSRYQAMTQIDQLTCKYGSWSRQVPTHYFKVDDSDILAFCWTIRKEWAKKTTSHIYHDNYYESPTKLAE